MESLLLPIINYISQSFPEIPYVDDIIPDTTHSILARPSITAR